MTEERKELIIKHLQCSDNKLTSKLVRSVWITAIEEIRLEVLKSVTPVTVDEVKDNGDITNLNLSIEKINKILDDCEIFDKYHKEETEPTLEEMEGRVKSLEKLRINQFVEDKKISSDKGDFD